MPPDDKFDLQKEIEEAKAVGAKAAGTVSNAADNFDLAKEIEDAKAAGSNAVDAVKSEGAKLREAIDAGMFPETVHDYEAEARPWYNVWSKSPMEQAAARKKQDETLRASVDQANQWTGRAQANPVGTFAKYAADEFTPYLGMVPGETIPVRMAQGALLGGIQGGTNAASNASGNAWDRTKQIASGTGTGAAIGGSAVGALEGAGVGLGALGAGRKAAANVKLADIALPAARNAKIAGEGGAEALAQRGQELRDSGLTKPRGLVDYFRGNTPARMSQNATDLLEKSGEQVRSAEDAISNAVTPEDWAFRKDPVDVTPIRQKVGERVGNLEYANMPEENIAGMEKAGKILTPRTRGNSPEGGMFPDVDLSPAPPPMPTVQQNFTYGAGTHEPLPPDYRVTLPPPENMTRAEPPPPVDARAGEQNLLGFPEYQSTTKSVPTQMSLPFAATELPQGPMHGTARRAQPYPFPEKPGEQVSLTDLTPRSEAQINKAIEGQKADYYNSTYSPTKPTVEPMLTEPVTRPELREFTEAPAQPPPPPSPPPEQQNLFDAEQQKLPDVSLYGSGRQMTPAVDPKWTQGPMLPSERGSAPLGTNQGEFEFPFGPPRAMTPATNLSRPTPPMPTVSEPWLPRSRTPENKGPLSWEQASAVKREHQNAITHGLRDLNRAEVPGYDEGRKLVVDELRPLLEEHARTAAEAGRIPQEPVDQLYKANKDFSKTADTTYNLAQKARAQRLAPTKIPGLVSGPINATKAAFAGENTGYAIGKGLEHLGTGARKGADVARIGAGLGAFNRHPEIAKAQQANPGAPKATVEAHANDSMKDQLMHKYNEYLGMFKSLF